MVSGPSGAPTCATYFWSSAETSAGSGAASKSLTSSSSAVASSAAWRIWFSSRKRSKTSVASTKQLGTEIRSSGMMVCSPNLSLTLWRKRKPRPLPPKAPLPYRTIDESKSVIPRADAFSTPLASLLRWARASDRIQLRSQSGRSLPSASMKSVG